MSRLSTGGARHAAAVALAGGSLVASAAVGSIFLTTAREAWTAVAAAGPAGPADAILLVTGLGGAVLSIWLGLGLTLSALSAMPGALGDLCRGLADRVAPAVVRKIVALILGTTLSAALVPGTAVAGITGDSFRPAVVTTAQQAAHALSSPAAAAPDASFRSVIDSSDPSDRTKATDSAPPPTWSMERPASSLRKSVDEPRFVVHRGDSLWSIAARRLGPEAPAAEIDIEWRRWLAANRDVIGRDADLILPGQLLRPPPSSGASGASGAPGAPGAPGARS